MNIFGLFSESGFLINPFGECFLTLIFSLELTNHGIPHSLWPVNLSKSFSQSIMLKHIFSEYFFQ